MYEYEKMNPMLKKESKFSLFATEVRVIFHFLNYIIPLTLYTLLVLFYSRPHLHLLLIFLFWKLTKALKYSLTSIHILQVAWRLLWICKSCRKNAWKGRYVAVNINDSLSAYSLVNRGIELTCTQRHNLNPGRSQETLANYLSNAFQDLPADNGKANLFGWSVSYRHTLRKAHSNFTWYDRRFPFTLRLALPQGSVL